MDFETFIYRGLIGILLSCVSFALVYYIASNQKNFKILFKKLDELLDKFTSLDKLVGLSEKEVSSLKEKIISIEKLIEKTKTHIERYEQINDERVRDIENTINKCAECSKKM